MTSDRRQSPPKPPRPSPAPDERARIFVVDRREGRVLVLIDDDDRSVDMNAARLPKPCRAEGAVLRVPLDAEGNPIWQDATRDRAEERRRLDDLSKRIERLKRSDPGGDIVL